MYLKAEVIDSSGKSITEREWMFAPCCGDRPDDKAFLEEDKKRPDTEAAIQADVQGPHEPIIRAGKERILSLTPELKNGDYTVKARLIYDLNRYNERAFTEDQTEIFKTIPFAKVK